MLVPHHEPKGTVHKLIMVPFHPPLTPALYKCFAKTQRLRLLGLTVCQSHKLALTLCGEQSPKGACVEV